MKIIACVLLMLLLTACESEQPNDTQLSKLTCSDSREGRTKAELTAIGDACFRAGRFIKSSGREW